MDEIRIDELKIFAHHGVYPEETKEGQMFFVNAVLYTDTVKAGFSDELSDATNYGEVCLFINQFMTEHTYKLLEAAGEQLARALLLKFPLVKELDLEIRKPQAPIPLPFQSVSVKIHRGWHEAAIAFGSNMGDKKGYVDKALANLQTDPCIKEMKTSSYLVTKPYGGVEQDDFLNGAFVCKTLYTPHQLLDRLHEEEQLANRVREIHWGPRTLDLDILLYDDLIFEDDNLVIPHADMCNRDFVLRPLSEIAPSKMHPVEGKSIQRLSDELKER